MGDFTILCLLLTLLYGVPEVGCMTLRDALQEHLRDGPKPTSWDFDVAMINLINAPRDVTAIPASSKGILQDVFRFLPETHPTVINQILNGEHAKLSQIVQSFLTMPVEDAIEFIRDLHDASHPNRCLEHDNNTTCNARDSGKDAMAVASDVTMTTQPPSSDDECMADLVPMVIPPVRWLLVYIEDFLTGVKKSKELKGFGNFFCRVALDEAVSKIKKLRKTLPEVTQFPDWGYNIVDAIAKPPAAIVAGNLQWVGGFETCNEIKVSYVPEGEPANATRAFNGKYCRIMFGQRPNWNDTTNTTSEVLPISLGFGVCLPDTCATKELLENLTGSGSVVDALLSKIGVTVKRVFCGNELDFETDSRAQLAFNILIVLAALIACATVYDLLLRPTVIAKWLQEMPQPGTDKNLTRGTLLYPSLPTDSQPVTANTGHKTPDRLPVGRQSSTTSTMSLLSTMSDSESGLNALYAKPGVISRVEAAFVGCSIAVSFRKVFDVSNLGPSHLATVDGIRFLSIVFAVGGNTCLFGIIYTESLTSSNLFHKLAELPHLLIFQPVINYSFSADSFLVVSGIMVSYHWLRRLAKAGGRVTVKHLIHFYLHRYWSLMPVMMLVLMTYTCLYKYLLSGPLSPPQITDAENCRTSWWGNLLMVGNLVNKDASCLAWTWYVPLMFQLHVITPIILIPLSYRRWVGWIILFAFYAIFIFTVSGVVKDQIYGDFGSWYNDYLQTPWCRAGPYFIGVGVGVLLHEKYLVKIPKNFTTKLITTLLMMAALGTLFMSVLITYTKNRKENPVKWTEDQTISYHVFARSAWGLAIGYIILVSESGFSGILKSVLSHSCMTPLSRLAYPVFIVHAILIFRYAYTQFNPIYVTFSSLVYIFFGHLIFAFLVGMLVAVLFLTPFQGLEFAFFGAKTKLDTITAGSCPQVFRKLNLSRDEHHLRFNTELSKEGSMKTEMPLPREHKIQSIML